MKLNCNNEDNMRKSLKALFCIYCGDRATTEEHFPPKSYCSTGYLFSACQECNSLAGTSYPTDLERRATLVQDSIRDRLKDKFSQYELGSDLWFKEVIKQKERLEFDFKLYLSHVKIDLDDTLMDLEEESEPEETEDDVIDKKASQKRNLFTKNCESCTEQFNTARKNQIYCCSDCSRAGKIAKSLKRRNFWYSPHTLLTVD